MQKSITILVSGGHLAPAAAVISQIRRTHPQWNILFVGRPVSLEGSTEKSEEYTYAQQQGIVFLPLATGRLNRSLSVGTLVSLCKVPWGFAKALWYCLRQRPHAIVSFGGYVALPLAWAGWVLHIPVLTHEQTTVPGLTNRLIARIATRICVSSPHTRSQFPQEKTVYTGLPLRAELFIPTRDPSLKIPKNKPLLYITGGTTGAASLNSLVFSLVHELVKSFVIVHQTGSISHQESRRVQNSLPARDRPGYIPYPYLSVTDVAWIYQRAALVVGRSGANTVGEIAALGKPAVFIPLPWSAGQEQMTNAQVLASAGTSVILDQYTATAQRLREAIRTVFDKKAYRDRATEFAKSIPHDGAARVVHEIELLLA